MHASCALCNATQRNATKRNERKIRFLKTLRRRPWGSSIGLFCLKEIVCVLLCVRRHDQCGVRGAAAVGGRAAPRDAAPGPRAAGAKNPPVISTSSGFVSRKPINTCICQGRPGTDVRIMMRLIRKDRPASAQLLCWAFGQFVSNLPANAIGAY